MVSRFVKRIATRSQIRMCTRVVTWFQQRLVTPMAVWATSQIVICIGMLLVIGPATRYVFRRLGRSKLVLTRLLNERAAIGNRMRLVIWQIIGYEVRMAG